MCAQRYLCLSALLILFVTDGAWSYYEGVHRRGRSRQRQRQVWSYPRDWDTDWRRVRWQEGDPGDPVPEYNYQADQTAGAQPVLRPRLIVLPGGKSDTRGILHSQQRGSAVIPYPGATVRVTPNRQHSKKFYRGVVTSTITDGSSPKKRSNRNHRQRNRAYEQWEYSQDEPAHSARICARCPSDRAVLARKGSVTVLMETPPIIPCHPWSSVEKVKQEVVAGPQPGSEVKEGSHKIVIRLHHHRRTIATCITRYNVIVRKCPDLEAGPGVKTDCPLGKAWGAHCNITCDPGYDLEGDSDTECTDDLEWSGVMPQCIPTTSCPVPVSPDNGHLSCRTPQQQPARARGMLPDGTVCHYRCDAGYTVPPAQQHLTKARCVAGSWDNDQDPICIETNELEEEEPSAEITAEDALRFDGKDCPEDFCKNGGKCIMILNDPMCSCKTGYSGSNCEEENIDPDPDESNTIT